MPLLGLPRLQSATGVVVDRGARHRLRTRARLVAAARRLFGRRDVHEVAIADIADEADVGVGTFYNHFRSKQELFDVASAEAAAALAESLQRLVVPLADPAERVAACVRYVLRLVDEDPEWATFVVRASEGTPRPAAQVIAPLERYVFGGIACGRFLGDDPAVAATAISGVVLHMMRAKLLAEVGPAVDRTTAEEVLRLLGVDVAAAHAFGARPLPGRQDFPTRAGRRTTRRSARAR